MQPDIRMWLDYARNDFGVAKHLSNTYHPVPIEIVCYHCQQSAEKAIKGLYLFFDIPGGVPKKHDLSFLLDQIKHRLPIPEDVYSAADELNSFAVIVRYPSEVLVDESSMRKSLCHAEEILEWVESVLRDNEQ